MVETLGVDLKACVYLDDPGGNLKPAREMGIITIKRLNAAQAVAELEIAPGCESAYDLTQSAPNRDPSRAPN
jgi:putative hydrolase of the HAD superfamily